MSVRSYLATLKNKLEANAFKKPLSFVTGNQSADMDSVISALSFAYFQYKMDESFLIPLINIPRSEFKLRKDIVSLLGAYSITDDNLYFIDDFRSLTASANVPIKLTLVDHCNIQGETFTEFLNQGKLDVVGIIDHHEDESVFLDANPRIIHSNGSCSALVFNFWNDQFDNMDFCQEQSNDIIPLLLGPLLIDTSNMSNKVENGDVTAFRKYQNILEKNKDIITSLDEFSCQSAGDVETSISYFYSQIKRAKKDLSGFSFLDILKKDYKLFKFVSKNNISTSVGFSSVGKSFYWLLSHYSMSEISNTFNNIAEDLGLDLLVVTSSYSKKVSNEYTRELGYFYNSNNPRKDVLSLLAELAKNELKLTSEVYKLENFEKLKEMNDGQVFRVYNQQNLAASRKQIVPVIKNILENN